jgi:hypothetical protein
MFGTQVFEGPIRVIVNIAEIVNRDVAVAAFEAASAGDAICVEVESRGPVQYEIVNQSAWANKDTRSNSESNR